MHYRQGFPNAKGARCNTQPYLGSRVSFIREGHPILHGGLPVPEFRSSGGGSAQVVANGIGKTAKTGQTGTQKTPKAPPWAYLRQSSITLQGLYVPFYGGRPPRCHKPKANFAQAVNALPPKRNLSVDLEIEHPYLPSQNTSVTEFPPFGGYTADLRTYLLHISNRDSSRLGYHQTRPTLRQSPPGCSILRPVTTFAECDCLFCAVL